MSNSLSLKQELVDTIRRYNAKGWSPATSTNYSFKDEQGNIWVTRSGIDKALVTVGDFITVNEYGQPTADFQGVRPSAETGIHCTLYSLFPEIQVILHSHGMFPLLLASGQNEVQFEAYEVQKGFEGVSTHEGLVSIPVFPNHQDMAFFDEMLRLKKSALKHHCFIIEKHGTYAWGKDLFEAKRHLETLDYLSMFDWHLKSKEKI
jgi:methylthioribulose-1-phosphate dehydratase